MMVSASPWGKEPWTYEAGHVLCGVGCAVPQVSVILKQKKKATAIILQRKSKFMFIFKLGLDFFFLITQAITVTASSLIKRFCY